MPDVDNVPLGGMTMREDQPNIAPQADQQMTPQQEDEALQEAARRDAATREQPATEDQVFDTGNERGMGSGHGDRGDDDQG